MKFKDLVYFVIRYKSSQLNSYLRTEDHIVEDLSVCLTVHVKAFMDYAYVQFEI